MQQRLDFLAKVSNESDYDIFVSRLFDIYHDLNFNRKLLCPLLEDELVVFGGMIYFVLLKEAKLCGLIRDEDLDERVLRFKTSDLDIFGLINSEREIDEKLLKEMISDISLSFQSILTSKTGWLNDLSRVLGHSFSTTTIGSEESFTTCLEVRPQLFFHDHEVLEILIHANDSPLYVSDYDTKFVPPFKGENVLVSIRDQLFPLERLWKKIDWVGKSKEEIYSQIRDKFADNEIERLKFVQGFVRSETIAIILKRAIESREERFLSMMIPSNSIMTNLVFFLKSNLVRILVPDICKKGAEMYTYFKNANQNLRADYEKCLEFVSLSLKMWKMFDNGISSTF